MFLKYIQPSIEIGNLRIDEPMTVLTDLLLAGICFLAYFRLRQLNNSNRIGRYFAAYFLCLGLGSFFGALLSHAFIYKLPVHLKLLSWLFVLLSVGFLSVASLDMARPLLNPVFSRIISRLNVLLFIVAAFYTIWNLAFSPVKYYTIFGMVIMVGLLSIFVYRKTGKKGHARLATAVGIGILSVFVFSYEWGFGPWFNHNDLSHVILSFATILLYKGASLLSSFYA